MSGAAIPGKPPVSSSKSTSIGKFLRNWRRRTACVACLFSFMSVIATMVFFYLAPKADIQSRHPVQIAAAAFVSAAVVLLFRGLDGRFAIQMHRGGDKQSSSVIGVLLWIACFAVLSAASILVELRDPY